MTRPRGNVVERGRGWYAIVSITDATGKRHRPRQGPFPTRGYALAALSAMVAEADAGRFVMPSQQHVANYLKTWLEGRRHDLRPTTASGYRGVIDRYINPTLGRVSLGDLAPQQVRAVYAQMGDRGLSARTVRHVHVLLVKALGDAVNDSLIPRSPMAGVRPPRIPNTELVTWGPDELSVFLDYAKEHASPQVYAALYVAATTGMRRGELLGLRWGDVDFDAGVLHVRQTRLTLGGKTIEGTPKTARSRRQVAVDAGTVGVLRAWRLAQRPGFNLVFPMQPNSLSKTFIRLVADAGLPRIRLHDLRHAHASIALAAGVPIPAVSARLGHAGAQITLQVYSHALPGSDADAAERFAAMMAVPAPGSAPKSAPAGS